MAWFYGVLSGRYDWFMDRLYGRRDWGWRKAALDTLTASDRVLEVGAGTGRTSQVSPPVKQYVSLDITQAMLAASTSIQSPVQGDVHFLPFPEKTFHVVVATLLMSTRIDHKRAIREMARVVRPEGRIVLIDKFGGATRRERFWDSLKTWLTYPLAFEFGVDIEQLACQAGLSVIVREPVPHNMGMIEKVVLR